MLTHRFTTLAGAAVATVLLAACVDSPTSPSPGVFASSAPSRTVVGGPDLSDWKTFQGEVWICKDGNKAGTFSFDWSVVLRKDSSFVAAGTATVALGQCVLAIHLDTLASVPVHVNVTEQTPPANWALTAINWAYGAGLPGTPDIPIVNVSSRTISLVHAGNDVGVQITFTNTYTPPAPLCTYTQGFWKTHQELWDAAGEMIVWNGQTFFNSGKTYAQIYATSAAGGNSYVKLAYQYMAAKLNVNFGADPTITAAIAQAEALFAAHPAGSFYIKDAAWNAVATTLDNYNNGLTGPGHCPD